MIVLKMSEIQRMKRDLPEFEENEFIFQKRKEYEEKRRRENEE